MITPYIDDCELIDLEDDLKHIPRRYAHGDWFAHRRAISQRLREPDPTNNDPTLAQFYAKREEEDNNAVSHNQT